MSKVAVASTDGIAINEHFGRSKEFWIYEVAETGAYQFIERREKNAQAAHAGKGHTIAAQLLADVEVVLATQIGPRAEQELQSHGVLALPVSGPIDKALKTYGQRRKFIKDNIPRASIASHPGGAAVVPMVASSRKITVKTILTIEFAQMYNDLSVHAK